MNNQYKTYGWGIVGIVIILSLIWWGGSTKNTSVNNTEEPIKIGFIGPLTGGVALWGNIEKNSMELAREEINENGGVNGRMLQVSYEDGKCNGKEAVTAGQKLINEEGIRIIFPMCSAEILAIAPLAQQTGSILLTSATHSEAAKAGDFVFRVSYSDADIASIAAKTIAPQFKKIGVLYENVDYPLGIKNAFEKSATELGSQVITEAYERGAKDVRSQITKLRGKNVETVFIIVDGVDTATVVLRQLRETGFSGQIYGNYFGDAEEIATMKESEGLIYFSNPLVPENETKTSFFEKYRERYGSNPDIEFAAAQRYDAMMILRRGLEKVGDDPQMLKKYFYEMEDFTGLLGTYRFTPEGDITRLVPAVKTIKDGEAKVYE
ncbi:MAG TPA: ABC transporter substrate-binding protein [Candidatus Andersenbacteria bacterium]|nr:ABC transporter substrate-binding protein [Candidatus Andersenbacteria bacterium]